MSRMSIEEEDAKEKNCNSKTVSVYEKYVQSCFAELLGAAFIVFTGCLSVIENVEGTGRLQPAVTHGFAVGISVAIFENISGGHFNPAVSLNVCLIGGLNFMLLIPYCVSQLCGGLVGAALAKAVTTNENFANASGAAINIITADDQITRAVVAEIILTSLLLLTVSMGAINEKSRTPLAPFSIGLTVTTCILAGGDISGACMNPARAFGPAVVSGIWAYHWVYWVGPIVAAFIIGALLRLLLGDNKIRLFLK
ncbi:aquaporin-8 [Protopterus annectens]|uniref:aquaporin-8 n=1 Tax=Protopterus annectens TaxID=7888 RepID=UPI001CFB8EEA|nr:aquaporin-8 [Protopterus annectens]